MPVHTRLTFLLIFAVCHPRQLLGFAPTSKRTALSSVKFRSTSSPSSISRVSPCSPRTDTAISGSRQQAEQYLSEAFPRFCWLLQQNPAALQRMRESKSGFAVLAPSDDAILAMGVDRLQMLEASVNDPGLQQIVSRMAAYHIVSVPMTTEIMGSYSVVPTRVGELPVEAAPDGTLWVNGRQIIQSYQFEDNIVESYQDKDGNVLGSQPAEGGKTCIIHEVDGLVCPDELWQAMFSHLETSGMGGA